MSDLISREAAIAAIRAEAWPEDGTYPPEHFAIRDIERATVEVCEAAIRALPATPAPDVAGAARVLLDDLVFALDPMAHGDKSASVKRWTAADDAAEKAPTAMVRPTPIQMIRAALRQIAGGDGE